jgi:hypothetical protein
MTYQVGDVLQMDRNEYRTFLGQTCENEHIYERLLARMTQPFEILRDLGLSVYSVKLLGPLGEGEVYALSLPENFPVKVRLVRAAGRKGRKPFAKKPPHA